MALVDDEDFEALALTKWNVYWRRHAFYAKRHVSRPGGGRTTAYLHRLVLAWRLDRDLAKGEDCDHINGNGLDNRRANLRVATRAQNNRNCRRRVANPSSRYLGVTWREANSKWQSRVSVNGKNVSLGCYATEIDAALAREAYIAAHPELYARTNFPGEAP